jgi:hypothetical protein
MMTSDEPRFEVEIHYTKPVIQSIAFDQVKWFVMIFLISTLGNLIQHFFFPSMQKSTNIINGNLFSDSLSFLFSSASVPNVQFICKLLGDLLLLLPLGLFFTILKQQSIFFSGFGNYLQLKLFENHLLLTSKSTYFNQTELKWQSIKFFKKYENALRLYLDEPIKTIHIPYNQISPEAQAFILKKLTEYNVPIKD